MDAMSLAPIYCRKRLTAPSVLGHSDNLKMSGIDADGIAAQMIERHTSGDPTDEVLVTSTMSILTCGPSPPNGDLGVPTVHTMALPFPAPRTLANHNWSKKPVEKCSTRTTHQPPILLDQQLQFRGCRRDTLGGRENADLGARTPV